MSASTTINVPDRNGSAPAVLGAKDPNKLLTVNSPAPSKPTNHVETSHQQILIPGLGLGLPTQSTKEPQPPGDKPPFPGLVVNHYNPSYHANPHPVGPIGIVTARRHALKFRKWTVYEDEVLTQTAAHRLPVDDLVELLPGRTRGNVIEREEKINQIRERNGLTRLGERRESDHTDVNPRVLRTIVDAAREKQREVDERKAKEAKAHAEYGERLMKEVDRDIAFRKARKGRKDTPQAAGVRTETAAAATMAGKLEGKELPPAVGVGVEAPATTTKEMPTNTHTTTAEKEDNATPPFQDHPINPPDPPDPNPKPPRKGKLWTEGEDEQLLHMWYQMKEDDEIAPVLGRTIVAVRHRRQMLMDPEARGPMREVYERVSRRYVGGGVVEEEERNEGWDED